MNGKLNLEWHNDVSIRTLAVCLWDSFEHDWGEISLEVDTHVVVSDDTESFEEVGRVEPDDGIFSFYGCGDTDIPRSYLGISRGDLETGFGMEGDTGIVVVFTGDEVRSLEGDDEIVTEYDSLG